MKPQTEPVVVWSKDRVEQGRATGGERECRMEGCRGRRIVVKWPNGKITHPCTKGMRAISDTEWEIL